MGRGVKGKGREKGGTPLQSTPPVKKSWIRACIQEYENQSTERSVYEKNL